MKVITSLQHRNKLSGHQRGSALISLLVMTAVSTIVLTTAVQVLVVNSQSSAFLAPGAQALAVAQAGMEEARLRLLRTPSYVGGTLAVEDGTATITVTGSNPYTITSLGSWGNSRRTLYATITITGNVHTSSNWQEQ